MTTLRAAARAARDRLLAARVSENEIEAEVEAEVLLRHAMAPGDAVSKAHLYSRYEESMAPEVGKRFEALLTRRLAREPTAYITGHREFYGLDFRVTPDVLIPRPETELLVEAAIHLANGGRSRPSGRLRIVDIGTGSGAIAVALARTLPQAEVYATDVSRSALGVARENARRHGVEGRIAFRAGYLLTPLHDYVDLVAANLPYVPTQDWQQLAPELREHEPRLALDGGEDGLELIRVLLLQAPRYLRPGGSLCVELGEGQAKAVLEAVSKDLPGADVRMLDDFAGVPRVLVTSLRPA